MTTDLQCFLVHLSKHERIARTIILMSNWLPAEKVEYPESYQQSLMLKPAQVTHGFHYIWLDVAECAELGLVDRVALDEASSK